MKHITLLILLIFGYKSYSQISIKNLTGKNISKLYIIEYDSILKTESFCEFIRNKNLITKTLTSNKEVKLNLKLSQEKFYNLISVDTTGYPKNYSNLVFKYYFSGGVKKILLESKNIESDFWGHCTEGVADRDFENYNLVFNNGTIGNIIKIYYKFQESGNFLRYNYFYQWKPIKKGESKKIILYNKKPIDATKIYIRYIVETMGVIKEFNITETILQNKYETQIDIK